MKQKENTYDRRPETIVAIATPPGEGGIGIVRLSGPRALAIGKRLFRFAQEPGEIESHRLYPGTVVAAPRPAGERDDPRRARPARAGTGRPMVMTARSSTAPSSS